MVLVVNKEWKRSRKAVHKKKNPFTRRTAGMFCRVFAASAASKSVRREDRVQSLPCPGLGFMPGGGAGGG